MLEILELEFLFFTIIKSNNIYSALDIVKYIIISEREKGHIISNLKLQKVLYFIQAEFLVIKNEPCFKEDIIATDFGPIILEVYHEYKILLVLAFPLILR
ncbi:MAG: DUF4065 domain-containing protein [Bacilli bacterium]|nr:DUF4065 domain-containing protein [Bacilli bacterium]